MFFKKKKKLKRPHKCSSNVLLKETETEMICSRKEGEGGKKSVKGLKRLIFSVLQQSMSDSTNQNLGN